MTYTVSQQDGRFHIKDGDENKIWSGETYPSQDAVVAVLEDAEFDEAKKSALKVALGVVAINETDQA